MNLLKTLFSRDVEDNNIFDKTYTTQDFFHSFQDSWQESKEAVAIVRRAIDPGQLGRVRFQGVWWRACCDRTQSIPAGTLVRVLGRRANILVVETV